MEVLKDMLQFQNRIKIAFAVYDKFSRIDRPIESGRNGNGALPEDRTGKDLQNREGDQGSGKAIISR
jgi:hypothetical protein